MEEIMRNTNREMSNIKMAIFLEKSEKIRIKNRENIISSNFRNLKYEMMKRAEPNFSSCYSIEKLNLQTFIFYF